MKRDERRPVKNAVDTNAVASEDTTRIGGWPRCPDCGHVAPTEAQVARHRVRDCVGAGWSAMRLRETGS